MLRLLQERPKGDGRWTALAALALFLIGRWTAPAEAATTVTPVDEDDRVRDLLEGERDVSLYEWHMAGDSYSQSSYYSQPYYQNYYQSYYQSSYAPSTPDTTFTKNVVANQDVTIFGALTKSAGTFVIDHPLDPVNKLLFHSFVESPDVKNLYDGVATLDESGEVRVTLPDYFMALNRDFRYQVKPIDAAMPNVHVKQEIIDGSFVIGGGAPGKRVSWQVTGIRHDPYILANPMEVEKRKGPDALVDEGEYLYEGARPTFFSGPIFDLIRRLFSW